MNGQLTVIPTISAEQMAITEQIISSVVAGVGEGSRDSYRLALVEYLRWVLQKNNQSPYYNAFTLVSDYKAYLSEQYQPATANKRLSAVRKLYEFAASYSLIDYAQWIAVSRIKNIKEDKGKLQLWISEDQARQLLYAPDTSTVIGKRDQVAILLMLVLWLRRDEAVNVKWDQIKQINSKWYLTDVMGKSKDSRTVEIPLKYMPILEAWGEHGKEGYILTSVDSRGNKGECISTTAVNTKIIGKYEKQLGFKITPHALRRTGATVAREKGATVDEIRGTLGHQDEKTTRIYLRSSLALDSSATKYIDL